MTSTFTHCNCIEHYLPMDPWWTGKEIWHVLHTGLSGFCIFIQVQSKFRKTKISITVILLYYYYFYYHKISICILIWILMNIKLHSLSVSPSQITLNWSISFYCTFFLQIMLMICTEALSWRHFIKRILKDKVSQICSVIHH